MLEVRELTKSFAGLVAVKNVSFTIEQGSINALIGPNGAGKTTMFNLITSFLKPTSGQILLNGQDVTGLRPDQACRAGFGRTFQIAKPLADLTVEENVMIGALKDTADVRLARKEARVVLELLRMDDRADTPAHSLTLPDRKRLEVAKALATKPSILLLDEVMAGLRPTETDVMIDTFRTLNKETGLTIVLIEHVMRAVMALSEKVVVVHHGEKIAEGDPRAVVSDPKVLECYLGEEVV